MNIKDLRPISSPQMSNRPNSANGLKSCLSHTLSHPDNSYAHVFFTTCRKYLNFEEVKEVYDKLKLTVCFKGYL